MRKATFAIAYLLFCSNTQAQPGTNDLNLRDTVSFNCTVSPINISSTSIILEVWVYSDETVLSFSGDFQWDNNGINLDSARISPLLESNDFIDFLYYNDDIVSSNDNRTIQLGGYSTGHGLDGDPSLRRLWATYYFSSNNWQAGDSVRFDIKSGTDSQIQFVSPGPFYPVSFDPLFSGPVRFPEIPTDVPEPESVLPVNFELFQNYPNPFNPETNIQFELKESTVTEISIFNLLGQRITTLYHGRLSPGIHEFKWNAHSKDGADLPSGTYLYVLKTELSSESKKMLLIR